MMADCAVVPYVSGINLSPNIARDQMVMTKLQFGKTDKILAYHGYQSFLPGEVTPDIAHEIGVKLAERLWGDRFQVLVTTHLDHEHIHNVRPDRAMRKAV